MRIAVVVMVGVGAAIGACKSEPPPVIVPVRIAETPRTPATAIASAPVEEPRPKKAATRAGGRVFSLPSLTSSGDVTIVPGRVTVVHFWATWCEPCKKAFPKLQELYARYRGRGLDVVAISVDDDTTGVATFARTYGATFPVGWDDDHKVAQQWRLQTMPTTFVVGKDGDISTTHGGYHDGDEAEIEKEIQGLL